MEISNLTILAVFVAVVILSLFVTGITGNVLNSRINVTIEQSITVNFTTNSVDFGGGKVNSGASNTTIDTLGNVINGNWTPVFGGFVVENLGNINISVNLKTEKTAAGFLGGTNPEYQFNVSNVEANSCINSTNFNLGEWYEVNTTAPGTKICDILEFAGASNRIRIDIRLVIPSDSRKGALTDTFTATATAV